VVVFSIVDGEFGPFEFGKVVVTFTIGASVKHCSSSSILHEGTRPNPEKLEATEH
jgi:hypothetical protein